MPITRITVAGTAAILHEPPIYVFTYANLPPNAAGITCIYTMGTASIPPCWQYSGTCCALIALLMARLDTLPLSVLILNRCSSSFLFFCAVALCTGATFPYAVCRRSLQGRALPCCTSSATMPTTCLALI